MQGNRLAANSCNEEARGQQQAAEEPLQTQTAGQERNVMQGSTVATEAKTEGLHNLPEENMLGAVGTETKNRPEAVGMGVDGKCKQRRRRRDEDHVLLKEGKNFKRCMLS
ncbi:hypothetical protein EXN66_Car000096 [Channa argus]|uniref:Uncharacterized protein n=1 Tax=Channa argus TaxID=215402 RepID=A0A6G1QWL8_CHAAH|nr:hypothetical protein EXN66_Car000096 [Channa argus]